MDAATREPEVLASCHQPLLSQLYFCPLGMREGDGFARSGARRDPPVRLLK